MPIVNSVRVLLFAKRKKVQKKRRRRKLKPVLCNVSTEAIYSITLFNAGYDSNFIWKWFCWNCCNSRLEAKIQSFLDSTLALPSLSCFWMKVKHCKYIFIQVQLRKNKYKYTTCMDTCRTWCPNGKCRKEEQTATTAKTQEVFGFKMKQNHLD